MKRFLLFFALVSLLLGACKLTANVTPIVVLPTRTLHSTFTLVPALTVSIPTATPTSNFNKMKKQMTATAISPTETILATPIPWPTEKYPPPTPVRTPDYPTDVSREAQKLVKSSERLRDLIKSPEKDNPDWIQSMILASFFVGTSYEFLHSMTVPSEMNEFHSLLLNAVHDCYLARQLIAPHSPPYAPSEDDFNRATELLISCQEQVAGPMRIIEETFITQ